MEDNKSLLSKLLPITEWLPQYSGGDVYGDVVAGLAVGIMAVPQSMAQAAISDINEVYGLYTCFIPLLVFAAFTTSKHMANGTGALVAVIVGGEVEKYEDVMTRTYAAVWLAFLVGIIHCLLGLLRLGAAVEFLSRPVLSGFITGLNIQNTHNDN